MPAFNFLIKGILNITSNKLPTTDKKYNNASNCVDSLNQDVGSAAKSFGDADDRIICELYLR